MTAPPLPDPSAEPLRRWQEQADPEALDQLLRNEIGLLKYLIRQRRGGGGVGSTSTSDIAQEAVLGYLNTKEAPTFDDPRALRGYLWRSAWRLLVKRFEKQARAPARTDLASAEGGKQLLRSFAGLSDVDVADRATAIDFALHLLAHEDRELIRRVYFDGADIATAGKSVGLAREAANSRLVRARRVLAVRLAEWSELIG